MREPNRERKNEIKFNVELTEEQKICKKGIYDYDISIILGNFASGKTFVAAVTALDMLMKKQVDKIFITRPIDFKATGYLTGDVSEKMSFHLFPLKQNFYKAYKKEIVDKFFIEGKIEIVPINYMKGFTIDTSVLIVDEFEDITYSEFRLLLTRLGRDSKLIFTGSEEQIDIKNSCISKIKCLENSGLVNFKTLTAMHRNEAIPKILDFIDAQ